MTLPTVAAPVESLYRSYWKSAPALPVIRVESARDVDLEAGFEPTLEATFSSLSDAEDYIAEWQEVYPDRIFLLA